jgi:hypothetical protein
MDTRAGAQRRRTSARRRVGLGGWSNGGSRGWPNGGVYKSSWPTFMGTLLQRPVSSRIVPLTFSDGRTMATGASVTWTHWSVLFEVTWDKTLASARTHPSVRADTHMGLRLRGRTPTSVWTRTWVCVRADAPQHPRGRSFASAPTWAFARTHLPPLPSPSPSLSLPPLPSPLPPSLSLPPFLDRG